MKKILGRLSLLLLLMCTAAVFGQIKILQNETLDLVGKSNSVELYKRNNRYTITYQDINDANLNTYRSFSYADLDHAHETLYRLITNGLTDMPTKEIQLELPDDIVGLSFAKNYGKNTVQFIHYMNKNYKYIGKTSFLDAQQVAEIFGKPIPPVKPKARKTPIRKKR